MKKHYACLLQLIILTLFTGISYGQTFTDDTPAGSETFTIPGPGTLYSVTVEIWGAGGAGGGSNSNNKGGSGGGGGAYSTLTFLANQGDIISYDVGAGGSGSTVDGNSGGNTTLNHTTSGANLAANGGGGGTGNGNPFGHSARRIGDLFAGFSRDVTKGSAWKRLRKTKHTHHPVDDARGNVEALLAMEDMGLRFPE